MVLLSFDIEEFDLPQEYGQVIDVEEQIAISELGLSRLLDVLEREGVVATFYSTAFFMERIGSETRLRLINGGHEIASHGYYHSRHSDEDYGRSLRRLEELTLKPVRGYRMPRMQEVKHDLQCSSGYSYDSSLHPTYIPGRYNHLSSPRLPHRLDNGLWILPASVLPYLRFPLFWLSMHNLPMWLYERMLSYTARHDKYLNIYLHPWEFADLRDTAYQLPSIILRNSGGAMLERLTRLIRYLRSKGLTFSTTSDYLALYHQH